VHCSLADKYQETNSSFSKLAIVKYFDYGMGVRKLIIAGQQEEFQVWVY
jgi:hypothetical protein